MRSADDCALCSEMGSLSLGGGELMVCLNEWIYYIAA